MRLSLTLFFYIARACLGAYAAVAATFGALMFIKDVVTMGRRATAGDEFSAGLSVQLAGLRLPATIEYFTPLIFFAACMYVIWRLTRHHELVAARAAGVSVWQFLLPTVISAMVLGLIAVALLDPVAARGLAAHDALLADRQNGERQVINVSSVGAWLRYPSGDGVVVVHADDTTKSDEGLILQRATFVEQDLAGGLKRRIDAQSAVLLEGEWLLSNVLITHPDGQQVHLSSVGLPANLRLAAGGNAVDARTVGFWNLSTAIVDADRAGISSIRYRVQRHLLLSMPLLLCAMALAAASFSLRIPRLGGTIMLIVIGVGAGFIIELMKYVMVTLGNAGAISPVVAGWATPVAALLLAMAALIHLEEEG